MFFVKFYIGFMISIIILKPILATTGHISILQCVNNIQTKHYNDHTIIISTTNLPSDELSTFKHRTTTVLYSGKNLTFPRLLWKFQQFIFIVSNSEEYSMILKSLYGTQLWNSRGKYLVGYYGDDDFSDIFEISWSYYIYNIDIIATNINVTNIYTYFPYKNNRCGKFVDYDLLGQCGNDDTGDIFPEKIPLDYYGCNIRFMAYPMIPYVLNLNASHERPADAGLEVTMVHVLSQRMNFTKVYIPHNHAYWGYIDSAGKYQFMFGSLYNKECDVLLGMTFGNASHIVDFDGGMIHLIDHSVWWVPVALPIPQWQNLTTIFDRVVWLSILIVFLVNGFACWILGRGSERSADYNELVLSIMGSLYTLLQGSMDSPKAWKLRLMYILWLMACLLIVTAYQCQLVSILTSPVYQHQIDSVEEVVNSTLKYGMFVGAALAFQDPTNWIQAIIFKNYKSCPLSNYCMNRTAFHRDYATLRNLRNARYFLPRYYTTRNGKLMLYQIKDSKIPIWVRFYYTKGFPLLGRINNLIGLMHEGGLIDKWDKDISYSVMHFESDPEHQPLNINHLQGAFYILAIGICISLFVFVCELIYKCKKNRTSTVTVVK